MIRITYSALALIITAVWILIRAVLSIKSKRFDIKRELSLILVYICIVVVVRFTFFPFSKANGVIQPLIFDINTAFPPRINLVPFIYWFDYETKREALLNLIGNIAMFIPLGIVWPSVFSRLDSHLKVLLSGFGCSFCIEVLQLPFYDRVSDIDDLILNTFGFAVGYGIFLLFGLISAAKKRT